MEPKQISVFKDKVLKAYRESSEEGKRILENVFGKETFKLDVKDRITSYEDACKELNINPAQLSDFNFLPEKDREAAFGFHQITTIIEAYNEDWKPDWLDINQCKYYPYFKKNVFGLTFSSYNCEFGSEYVRINSRLALKSSDLAIHVGETFIDIYNKFL